MAKIYVIEDDNLSSVESIHLSDSNFGISSENKGEQTLEAEPTIVAGLDRDPREELVYSQENNEDVSSTDCCSYDINIEAQNETTNSKTNSRNVSLEVSNSPSEIHNDNEDYPNASLH